MSVPLDGLAIYDTNDRVHRARVMAEYRRQALEELEHIKTFQKQHPVHNHDAGTTPVRPSTPSRSMTQALDSVSDFPALPSQPGATDEPLAAARATPKKAIQTPQKPGKKMKEIFTRTPRKKTQDDFSDIRRAMGPERLTPLTPRRPRTADPSAGGQLPGEDSWEWYQRNMTALPPMPPLPPVPPLPSPKSAKSARYAGVHPAFRSRVED